MIVVDTHVLIWAVHDDTRLGKAARKILDEAVALTGIHVAAITPWEIALLSHKGRLALGRETGAWIDAVLALPGMVLRPLLPSIAIDAVRLPGELHADPADRMIIATARAANFPLLTADGAILAYGARGHVAAIDAAL